MVSLIELLSNTNTFSPWLRRPTTGVLVPTPSRRLRGPAVTIAVLAGGAVAVNADEEARGAAVGVPSFFLHAPAPKTTRAVEITIKVFFIPRLLMRLGRRGREFVLAD